ncbi:hypothetical protein NBRC3257_0335 [Gluconobacter thailandicus NBRC 3257]|uniref:Transposase n=1 Tax=Gluconobacter thailandicus NBRC 3257 TaxID=1381097 RepID=A0ABQ0IT32_GLUTH|nr:hypothetical protein NBRC3255_1362 [Gluconobacter thailandicus NBRC 3255]GAD25336.1 hypothetical protein NBRC3257_0335 [Gluconobacter thailandicus NBRC 3257]
MPNGLKHRAEDYICAAHPAGDKENEKGKTAFRRRTSGSVCL